MRRGEGRDGGTCERKVRGGEEDYGEEGKGRNRRKVVRERKVRRKRSTEGREERRRMRGRDKGSLREERRRKK